MGSEKCQSGSRGVKTYAVDYSVDYSESFLQYYESLVNIGVVHQLDRIDDFVEHYEKNGLSNWKGKISSSDRLPQNYPNRNLIIQHARNNSLWHVHIGDPCFRASVTGKYQVSDGVLHFQKLSSYTIKIISVSYHDPMTLPDSDEFE
jgi:hypothetical protein